MEQVERHKGAIQNALSRRLRWQIRILAKVLEGRNTTYRVCILLDLSICWPTLIYFDMIQSKVELLASQLDEGEGV